MVESDYKSDELILKAIKNRHAVIRGLYVKIKAKEPTRKIESILYYLQEYSGYGRTSIIRILRKK
jgi:hypothetical protein